MVTCNIPQIPNCTGAFLTMKYPVLNVSPQNHMATIFTLKKIHEFRTVEITIKLLIKIIKNNKLSRQLFKWNQTLEWPKDTTLSNRECVKMWAIQMFSVNTKLYILKTIYWPLLIKRHKIQQKCSFVLCMTVPHPYSRFIFEIAIELWRSKHSFSENGHKTQGFKIHRIVCKRKCQYGPKQTKQYNSLDVITKMRPIPKMFHFEI